jgi:sterol desaturase/sphingolipid hydroxylase (fatty acid hydroxylase superfamily)
MSEQEFQLLRSAGFVAALLIAVMLQRRLPHAGLRGAWRVNGGLWLTNIVVMSLVCGACACAASLWVRAAGIGVLNVIGPPPIVAAVVTVVFLDLVSYAWHRANHRLAFLWRFHRVHHSDATFTVSTGLRFHPGELLLSLPVRLAAIAVIGAAPLGIIVFEFCFATANLIEHGDISLPARLERVLGRVFVTPALHRWHHSRQRPALNTNFGTVFVVWDRLLATYGQSTSSVRVDTGLPDGSGPILLTDALALPWRGRTSGALPS